MAYTYSSTSGASTSSNGTATTTGASTTIDRYSDLNLQMMIHPQKKDIVPITGDAAVKNAIRTLLLTNFMERPFQPNLGANLRSLLFEPNDAVTRLALKDTIFNVLSLHEPRIENINVVIESTTNENGYRVTIIFSIKENDSIQEVEINLRRLR